MSEDSRHLSAPAGIIHRLRTVLRATGPLHLPGVVLLWTVRREFDVAVRHLDERLPEPSSPLDVTPERLEPDQLSRLAAAHPSTSAESMKRYLDQGARCSVWWIDNVPAHWRWETDREIYLPYLRARAEPKRGDLLTVEVFTDPAYRDLGIYTRASLHCLRRARGNGYSRALGLVASWNRPARAVMTTKTGYVLEGKVGVWTVGSWQRHFLRGAPPLDIRPA